MLMPARVNWLNWEKSQPSKMPLGFPCVTCFSKIIPIKSCSSPASRTHTPQRWAALNKRKGAEVCELKHPLNNTCYQHANMPEEGGVWGKEMQIDCYTVALSWWKEVAICSQALKRTDLSFFVHHSRKLKQSKGRNSSRGVVETWSDFETQFSWSLA